MQETEECRIENASGREKCKWLQTGTNWKCAMGGMEEAKSEEWWWLVVGDEADCCARVCSVQCVQYLCVASELIR